VDDSEHTSGLTLAVFAAGAVGSILLVGAVGAIVGAVLAIAVSLVMGVGVLVPAVAGAVIGGLIGTFLISESFVRVTFPLSLPGVLAGSLLTFIPAVGDYINALLLGTPNQYMLGNVIQSRFLDITDYPTAAALSFILMAGILVIVLVVLRVAGSRALTEVA
jgi:ABC-type molybdate transport system permease subunit